MVSSHGPTISSLLNRFERRLEKQVELDYPARLQAPDPLTVLTL